jgi:uncharacterized membrane protein (DUF4010 family)
MDIISLILKILLSFIVGGVLGLEVETRSNDEISNTERRESQSIGGVRTYSTIALLGAITGIFYTLEFYILIPIFFGFLTLLIIVAYALDVFFNKSFGLTTEIAVILTAIIGFMITSEIIPIVVTLILWVILAFFLSNKDLISRVTDSINHQEIIDLIQFGIITIVFLPLLPNQEITISDIFSLVGINEFGNLSESVLSIRIINPFVVWVLVVTIVGFSLFGYYFSKILGRKFGFLMTGVFSGFISSTAYTVAMAQRSNKNHNLSNLYAGSAILSNVVSIGQLGFLVAINNSSLFFNILIALAFMILLGSIISFIQIRNTNELKEDPGLEYPGFSILPALKFVSLIILIKFLVQFIEVIDISKSFSILSTLSAVVGVDASVIATADLVEIGFFSTSVGIISIMIAVIINFLAKLIYAYLNGSSKFLKTFSVGIVIMSLSSLIILFMV